MRAVAVVEQVASQKHATPAQIALAWLLHKGDDIVPIPGTKSRKRLEENVGAVSIDLTSDDMGRLEAALAPEKVSGERYNKERMSTVDR
jgi:aryl-alcohol dehydrogenase-like predicted oxidoreductase